DTSNPSGLATKLRHAALDGSGAVTLGSVAIGQLHGFGEDGTKAYWFEGSGPGTLKSVAITGGTASDVLTYNDDPDSIYADANGVYFTDTSGGDDAIYKVS